jgi:hypothetical protein
MREWELLRGGDWAEVKSAYITSWLENKSLQMPWEDLSGGKNGAKTRGLFSMSSLTRCVHLNPPQRIETPRVQCSGDLIAVPADPSHMIKTTASSILARSRFFFFFLFLLLVTYPSKSRWDWWAEIQGKNEAGTALEHWTENKLYNFFHLTCDQIEFMSSIFNGCVRIPGWIYFVFWNQSLAPT